MFCLFINILFPFITFFVGFFFAILSAHEHLFILKCALYQVYKNLLLLLLLLQ